MLVIDMIVAHDVYIWCIQCDDSVMKNLKKRNIKVNKTNFLVLLIINTGSGNIVPGREGFFFYFVIILAPSSRKFYNRNLPMEKTNTLLLYV